jgi:hypothetical protein
VLFHLFSDKPSACPLLHSKLSPMHSLHSDLVSPRLQVIMLVSSLHTPESSILVTQPIRSTWESVIRSIHLVLLQVLLFKANVTLAIIARTTRLGILGGEFPSVHIGSPVSLGMSLKGITQPLYVYNTPNCVDCSRWTFREGNKTQSTTSATRTITSTSTGPSTTTTCQTPGWWGCRDKITTTSTLQTTTTSIPLDL